MREIFFVFSLAATKIISTYFDQADTPCSYNASYPYSIKHENYCSWADIFKIKTHSIIQ